MARYGDLSYFNSLPLKVCVKLIKKAYYEREKQNAWEMWIAVYPMMTKESFVPFSKFYAISINDMEPKQHKSAADLLAEAQEIQKKVENSNRG